MKTIVVASRKGGSGKTTTVRHLAVSFIASGKRVLLIDTDAQGTLTHWHSRRKTLAAKDDLTLLQVAYDSLGEAKSAAEQAGFDILIIDTPPDTNDAISASIALADFVLIPSKASPDDINAVPRTHKLVTDLGIPCAFVINEAKPNTQLLTLALETLSQLGSIAPTQYNYVAVPNAMIIGNTVVDPSHLSAKPASDIKRLYDYVCDRLGVQTNV